uniref:Uncharacterized protein n=1 Tax=Anguilla anguilla TaxID=7936 RepID=A0A0E9PY08_ANGAN
MSVKNALQRQQDGWTKGTGRLVIITVWLVS